MHRKEGRKGHHQGEDQPLGPGYPGLPGPTGPELSVQPHQPDLHPDHSPTRGSRSTHRRSPRTRTREEPERLLRGVGNRRPGPG